MSQRVQKIDAARWEALRSRFLTRSQAALAIKEFERRTEFEGRGKLRHLLRHHDEETVTGRDTDRRYWFDLFLGYVSLLEIAHLIRYFDVQEEERSYLRVLENASVRSYYELHYPLLLPTLFRARLIGLWRWEESTRPFRWHGLFEEFLGLYEGFLADDVMWYFLDLLDDYQFEINLDDLLSALSSKKEMSALLMETRLHDKPLAKAAQGFSRFLSFCIRLNELLDRAESTNLLRSAMWHHYAFWFRELGDKVRQTITVAVANTDKWSSHGQQLRGRRAHTKHVVRMLASRSYSRPLERFATELL
jgi:hypothetical protein